MRPILKWFWKTTNLDLIVPIVVGLLAGVLALFEKISDNIATAVTLSSLAAISFGLLAVRERSAPQALADDGLTMERPAEFHACMESSDFSVLLVGTSLNRTLISHTSTLSRPGRNVRIVLSDPADDLICQAVARRRSVRGNPALVSSDIEGGVDLAREIRRRAELHAAGGVQVRLSNQVLTAGVTLFTHHEDGSKNRLLWEVYQAKGDTARQPSAWLRPGDPVFAPVWQEAEKLWADAAELS